MADLKTTVERRDRFRTWLHDDTRDHLSIRAWCVAEDACDDVDTLLAENAKLRTVAEALRAKGAEVVRLKGENRSLRDEREDYRMGDAHARKRLAPLLGLGETEESAEVMADRIAAEVERLRSEKEMGFFEPESEVMQRALLILGRLEAEDLARQAMTAGLAEVERLRTSLALAQSVLRALVDCDDAISAGGVPPFSRDEVAADARAALEAFCKRRSDVPATLARLLGEVSR